MRIKLPFQILILSLISLLMVIFSKSKDLITYFTLFSGLIMFVIISINVYYFPRMGLMKSIKKEKLGIIITFAILLAISGVILGTFQPIGWMNFSPFAYHIILSFLLILTLERVLKLRLMELK